MRTRPLLTFLLLLAGISHLAAQVNDKGTIHAAIGIAAGGHATEYEQTIYVLGVPVVTSEDDGAATVTYPIQLGYGFAKWFSLGVLVEPGSYLDSNATRSNSLVSFGVEPRFYLVNKDRFAWMASLQFGGSALRIDEQGANKDQAIYKGSHLGLGTGVGFYFSDLIGLQLHLRYLTTRLPLSEYNSNGTAIALDNFDAELKTRGVALQASLAFKF